MGDVRSSAVPASLCSLRVLRASAVKVVVFVVALVSGAAAGDDGEEPTTPLTRVVKVIRAEDEKPIAGAIVDAVGLPGGTKSRKTGDDGVVTFPNVPRRGVTFVARFDGRFPAWHQPCGFEWARTDEDYDDDGDGVTSMELWLVKGGAFEGRVVAKDGGAPIAGATVVAEQVAGATDQFELHEAPTWTAVTDAEGRFRTESHFPDRFRNDNIHLRITARASGWISEHVEVAPHGEAHAAFPLLRAARLRGVVKDGDGKAVAGALVHAYPPGTGVFDRRPGDPERKSDDQHPRVLHALTDAQGRYEMPELHPGVKFFVYAEREERASDDEFARADLVARSDVAEGVGTAESDEEAACDLKLHPLSSLVVRVAPDAGGDAKNIGYSLSSGPPHSYPYIDDDKIEGGRKFQRLDPGTYTLRVSADGWLALERKVAVPAGKSIDLTVRLDKGIGVDGVVVDDLGAPAEGVSVYAYPVDPANGRLRYDDGASAKTDAAGAFRLSGLPAGLVSVGAGDQRYVFEEKTHVTAPASGMRIVGVRVPFITLRVTAPPGASLPEKVLATVTTLSGHYAGMRDAMHVPRKDLPAKLDRLRPGPVDVTVDLPGFAPSTIRVELKPGESAPVGPFEFTSGVTLTGRVTDASGRPVAGARVTPYENDARTATTAADGSFSLPHLTPGATEICVVAGAFPETRLVATAAAGGYATAVTLRPGGTVKGKLTSREGDRIRARQLCIYEATVTDGYGPHWHAKVEDDDPRFSLRLPAGKYLFVPSRYEFGEGNVLFEVKEGATTEVAFELPW